MNCYLKLFMTFFIVLILSACGSSLEKPTGLENNDKPETKINLAENSSQSDLDDLEIDLKSEKEFDAKDKSVSEEKSKDSGKEKTQTDSNSSHKKDSADSKTTTKNKTEKKPSADRSKKSNSSNNSSQKSNNNSTKTEKNNSKKEVPEEPKEKEKSPEPESTTIIHSIVISDTEIPLPPTEMEIEVGDTVLEALVQITMANKIQMDYRGGQGSTAYVEGIANVYEFDRGQGSGWMYRLNGIFPDRGAGVVPLCAGDRVEWLYTTNLGQDLGADLKPVRRDGKCPN